MLDIQALEKAFTPKLVSSPIHRLHPLTKITIIILTIISIILTTSMIIHLIVFSITLLLIFLGRVLDRAISLLKAIKYPLLIMLVLFFVLYVPYKAILYALRLVISSLVLVIYFSTTKGMDIAQSLDKLGIGAKLADIFELSLRVIPLFARDAVESIEALTLRGVLGSRFSGMIDTLAMLVANSLSRTEKLSEALALKYYKTSRRTFPNKVLFGLPDIILILSYLILVLAEILT